MLRAAAAGSASTVRQTLVRRRLEAGAEIIVLQTNELRFTVRDIAVRAGDVSGNLLQTRGVAATCCGSPPCSGTALPVRVRVRPSGGIAALLAQVLPRTSGVQRRKIPSRRRRSESGLRPRMRRRRGQQKERLDLRPRRVAISDLSAGVSRHRSSIVLAQHSILGVARGSLSSATSSDQRLDLNPRVGGSIRRSKSPYRHRWCLHRERSTMSTPVQYPVSDSTAHGRGGSLATRSFAFAALLTVGVLHIAVVIAAFQASKPVASAYVGTFAICALVVALWRSPVDDTQVITAQDYRDDHVDEPVDGDENSHGTCVACSSVTGVEPGRLGGELSGVGVRHAA